MTYSLPCECGRTFDVRASDAGSNLVCSCGVSVTVPPLSVLRSSYATTEGEDDAQPSESLDRRSDVVFVMVVAAVCVFLGIVAVPALAMAGLLMFVGARIWLAVQVMREMALGNAALVFFVPFMPAMFLFKRFDIAWKPFFLGSVGIAAVMVAFVLTVKGA